MAACAKATDDMPIKAIAPWFGCARMIADRVAELLRGCRWVGIPFAGGMPEVVCIDAPTIVVADVHRHVINLAKCLADRELGPQLYRRLRRLPFCEEILDESQEWLKAHHGRPFGSADEEAAFHYFVAVWMGRSGKAGGVDEFNGGVPVRWNCNGGDSNARFRGAVASIIAWQRILRRCNIMVQDCFDFLANCQDEARHGIYCDPPFPDCGKVYRHSFTEEQHRRLARALAGFHRARVVCRFYDHPLIRELYPPERWWWHRCTGRKQSNAVAPEVLLVNHTNHAPAAGSVQQYVGRLATAQTRDERGNVRDYQQFPPGAVVDLPPGVRYEFPASGIDVSKYVQAIQAELRAIAARLAMPEFMLSADASNANYASTMVAEGPAVKAFERLQSEMIWRDAEILMRALRIAERAGRIPVGAVDLVTIDAEAPIVQSRNRLAEAQADQVLLTMGVVSPQSIAARHGYDWDQERDLIGQADEAVAAGTGGADDSTGAAQ